jgi:uncharacterized repeat protein (TIGR03803 family)
MVAILGLVIGRHPAISQTLKTLVSFTGANGDIPSSGLVQGTDGNFYGATGSGGASGFGTIFSMTAAGSLSTLHSFNFKDGAAPSASLVEGNDGIFYGTSSAGGTHKQGSVFRITSTGTLTPLYSFCKKTGCADGSFPEASLVQGSDGNFYGTTYSGGGSNCAAGCGIIFKITATGKMTRLHYFCAQPGCPDGSGPMAGLVLASDENFYGTTSVGGSGGNCGDSGCGTVFRITPTGSLTTVHSFNLTDGAVPEGVLVQGKDGNLYGTTFYGGVNTACGSSAGCGTAFKMTLAGQLSTIYSFCGQTDCSDGTFPRAGLVQGTDGNFYGTTVQGGNKNYGGTAFELTGAGQLTKLYLFCSKQNCTDGYQPYAGLIQAKSGLLYGTTSYGASTKCGVSAGCGTVFSLTAP